MNVDTYERIGDCVEFTVPCMGEGCDNEFACSGLGQSNVQIECQECGARMVVRWRRGIRRLYVTAYKVEAMRSMVMKEER